MYGKNNTRIRLLLGRQYRSKGKYNIYFLMYEIKMLLPEEYTIEMNDMTGYLYVTKVT